MNNLNPLYTKRKSEINEKPKLNLRLKKKTEEDNQSSIDFLKTSKTKSKNFYKTKHFLKILIFGNDEDLFKIWMEHVKLSASLFFNHLKTLKFNRNIQFLLTPEIYKSTVSNFAGKDKSEWYLHQRYLLVEIKLFFGEAQKKYSLNSIVSNFLIYTDKLWSSIFGKRNKKRINFRVELMKSKFPKGCS